MSSAVSVPILIQAHSVMPQPWRNGGGSTRELLTRPAGARSWGLRISVADVAADGPFSSFPGVQRWFAVLAGAGVRLRIGESEHLLDASHDPLHFAGDAPAHCRLVDGATRDLNLMHSAGTGLMQSARSGEPWRCASAGRGMFTRAAGTWRASEGTPLEVPAGCLLWVDDAGAKPWTFTAPPAAAAGAIPPALWLAWEP